MTFKSDSNESEHVFEVKDITPTGMQLTLKDGDHQFEIDHRFEGRLHWGGLDLGYQGTVQHSQGLRFHHRNQRSDGG